MPINQRTLNGFPGYNGELHEAGSRWQMLGNGQRAFNPALMHFHSPDDLSPFDAGGLNAYSYCAGDPVNFSDPTGHIFQWIALAGMLGTVASLAGALAANERAEGRTAQTLGWVGVGMMAATIGSIGMYMMNRHVWPHPSVGSRSAWSALKPNKVSIEVGDMRYFKGDSLDVAQVHGTPYVTWHKGPQSGGGFHAKSQARAGSEHPPRPLRLESCFAADGGTFSSAQRVADLRKTTVYAPKGPIGNSGVAGGIQNPERYRVFQPQSGVARAITAAGHRAMHTYAKVYHRITKRRDYPMVSGLGRDW